MAEVRAVLFEKENTTIPDSYGSFKTGYPLCDVVRSVEHLEGRSDLNLVILREESHAPDMMESVQRLKQRAAGLPVLVLANGNSPRDLLQVMELGVEGMVHESTDAESLLSAMAAMIRGHHVYCSTVMRLIQSARMPASTRMSCHESLTLRERELLSLLSTGASYDRIASQLHISIETVRTHIRNGYRKLGVHSKLEAFNKLNS